MNIDVRGKVSWTVTKDGQLVDEGSTSNLIVTRGRRAAAELVGGLISNFFEYVAVGSDSTAPANGQTALGVEYTTGGLGRAVATRTYPHTGTEGHVTYTISYTATASNTVREAGIFDSAAGGAMFARALVNSPNFIQVDTGVTLTIVWDLFFS